ncbi:MAG: Gfo/Idh/MocA family oxidoreductase [Kiritimatiellia bacterium]|nr:Gfo/Idh/MocA family oxidoreductase [Kiritimatiellia bacterium]
MGSKISSKRKTGVIRFGVVGVGGMGMGHCCSVQKVDNARLTAVCDVNFSTAEKAAQTLGVKAFADHHQLIRSGLCDVALIATPHPFHPQAAIDCMNAGLHVLTEKPLSERVSTAEKMIQAARRNRVAFAVNFQRRFEPAIVKAMELIRGGRIGSIYRAILISPEFRSQRYYDSGSWRATWSGEGGGVMMNQAPHVMDLFIQMAGIPSEVFGMIATRMHRIEVEDQADAILRYPNGGIGYLYCSTIEVKPGQMIEIFGDKGKLTWRDGKLSFYRFQPPIRRAINKAPTWGGIEAVEEKLKLEPQPAGNCVAANLVRHLLYGEKLVTPGESGLASLELANAITLSSFEKRWVKMPISRRKYDLLLNSLRRNPKSFKGRVR